MPSEDSQSENKESQSEVDQESQSENQDSQSEVPNQDYTKLENVYIDDDDEPLEAADEEIEATEYADLYQPSKEDDSDEVSQDSDKKS